MNPANLATARAGLNNYSASKVLNAPFERLCEVLCSSDEKTEWKSSLLSAGELSRTSEIAFADMPSRLVVFEHYKLAPGFQHRDYVLSCTWELVEGAADAPTRVSLVMQSTEDEAMPVRSDRVRAAINFLRYDLERLPDGAGVKVDVEVNLDPMGVVPIWFVNFYARSWCGKELVALEKQALSRS